MIDQRDELFYTRRTINDRPSHADQLHADLWWQGVNIALDPGTFQYNALPPWDNALASTAVHNTLIVDGKDQMQRAGRFLWLGWAQGEVIGYEMEEDGSIKRVIAEHDGYRHLGVQHRRSLQSTRNGWVVIDSLMPCRNARNKVHQFQLTWMLPDWKYQLKAENCLMLEGPDFKFKLIIEGTCEINLFRAGECIHGEMKSSPHLGLDRALIRDQAASLDGCGYPEWDAPINFSLHLSI